MATIVTRATMRTRARDFAMMEQDVEVTDTAVNDALNQQLAELYDEIRSSYGDEYFQTRLAITTAPGTELYALPADFLAAQRVECIPQGSTDTYPVDSYMPQEAALLRTLSTRYSFQTPFRHRIIGQNVSFLPVPSAAYAVTLYYTPNFVPLTADSGAGGTFDSINNWENFAVWGLVAYMLARRDGDPSFALGQKEQIRARIRSLAPQRNEGSPQRIADVRQRWGRFGGRF